MRKLLLVVALLALLPVGCKTSNVQIDPSIDMRTLNLTGEYKVFSKYMPSGSAWDGTLILKQTGDTLEGSMRWKSRKSPSDVEQKIRGQVSKDSFSVRGYDVVRHDNTGWTYYADNFVVHAVTRDEFYGKAIDVHSSKGSIHLWRQ